MDIRDRFKKIEKSISKNGLCFYLCDSDGRRRSSTWKIKRTKDNVYISTEGFTGRMKLSLHPDLVCQWGLVRNYHERNVSNSKGSFEPIRWERKETPVEGALFVASITFPTKYLKGKFSDFKEKGKEHFKFQIAPEGCSLSFGVFYSKEDPETLEQKFIQRNMLPIFTFDLENGEYVSFVFQEQLDRFALPDDFTGKVGGTEIEPVLQVGETMSDCSAIFVGQRAVEGKPIELVEINGFSISKS